MSRRFKTTDIAYVRNKRDGSDEGDTTQRLVSSDDGRHRPRWYGLGNMLIQALKPCFSLFNSLPVLVQDKVLGLMQKDEVGEPVRMVSSRDKCDCGAGETPQDAAASRANPSWQLHAPECEPACKFDPCVECAPWGGQTGMTN
ncbi:hypothetical protein [Rhizobium mongolense]|uniref:hypothetical protein n=1 Tax=Rhizobium mongolense TaxID=57676 RepID=UPI0035E41AAE